MSMAAFSSVRCEVGIFVPIDALVYTMGWLGRFLVGVRSGGGAYSVLPITRPQVVQTISPFSWSCIRVVLLHSGQKSFLFIREVFLWIVVYCCCLYVREGVVWILGLGFVCFVVCYFYEYEFHAVSYGFVA